MRYRMRQPLALSTLMHQGEDQTSGPRRIAQHRYAPRPRTVNANETT